MKQYAKVIFYDHSNLPFSLKEIGRTGDLYFADALEIYCETPNPASQMIEWDTEEDKLKAEKELQTNIKDPVWLTELHDCI